MIFNAFRAINQTKAALETLSFPKGVFLGLVAYYLLTITEIFHSACSQNY